MATAHSGQQESRRRQPAGERPWSKSNLETATLAVAQMLAPKEEKPPAWGTRGRRQPPPSHFSPFLFSTGGSFWRGVGKDSGGFSAAVHSVGGVIMTSSSWILPASQSHPVLSSESCGALCQLSFGPAPPGTSRPRPPRRCSPRWRRASGGCGPPLHRHSGGDLREEGEGNGMVTP